MSRRSILPLVVFAMGLFISGCATDGKMDELWRQGYGFNNPNPDRISQGLPPKDL